MTASSNTSSDIVVSSSSARIATANNNTSKATAMVHVQPCSSYSGGSHDEVLRTTLIDTIAMTGKDAIDDLMVSPTDVTTKTLLRSSSTSSSLSLRSSSPTPPLVNDDDEEEEDIIIPLKGIDGEDDDDDDVTPRISPGLKARKRKQRLNNRNANKQQLSLYKQELLMDDLTGIQQELSAQRQDEDLVLESLFQDDMETVSDDGEHDEVLLHYARELLKSSLKTHRY